MRFPTVLFGAALVSVALAAYTVQDDYSGKNFFGMFGFDTENDPTNGYVNYVDESTAQQDNLISVNNGVVTIRSDSANVASGRGRNSVRLTSLKQYTHGLVVLDLEHMPGSACGIWPAFWMTGPSWPNNGEIDIIEGVNYQSTNAMTLHTNAGCTMVNENCQGNQGCGVQEGGPASFGDGFNSANGGVYAMEWTSSAINIWFFGRNNVPAGVTGANPDPSTWGAALASFQGGSGCSIDDHFNNNNIVFDTTFCGDWAGRVWYQDSTCSSKAATCQDYVQNNPSAFESAYWTINSLKVYSSSGSSPAPATSVTPTTTPAAPVAQPTSTEAANSVTPTPTPSTAPGTVGLGSSTPGGTITENPITEEKKAAAPANVVTQNSDGTLPLGSGKRQIDTPFNSVVEQPAVTKRSTADGGEEMYVKKGKVMRHLRRHQMGGFSHHHS